MDGVLRFPGLPRLLRQSDLARLGCGILAVAPLAFLTSMVDARGNGALALGVITLVCTQLLTIAFVNDALGSAVSSARKRGWLVGFVLGAPIALPMFWLLHVWAAPYEEPTNRSSVGSVTNARRSSVHEREGATMNREMYEVLLSIEPTYPVATIKPRATVWTGVKRMQKQNVTALVVMRGEAIVGIFTRADVVRLVEAGADLAHVRVGDAMTDAPFTVEADVPLRDVIRIMRDENIFHLPITEGGRLIGVVSDRDILSALADGLNERDDERNRA